LLLLPNLESNPLSVIHSERKTLSVDGSELEKSPNS